MQSREQLQANVSDNINRVQELVPWAFYAGEVPGLQWIELIAVTALGVARLTDEQVTEVAEVLKFCYAQVEAEEVQDATKH